MVILNKGDSADLPWISKEILRRAQAPDFHSFVPLLALQQHFSARAVPLLQHMMREARSATARIDAAVQLAVLDEPAGLSYLIEQLEQPSGAHAVLSNLHPLRTRDHLLASTPEALAVLRQKLAVHRH